MAMKGLMARMERAVETVAEAEAPRPALAAPASRTVGLPTSIDVSSELEGTLRCQETLRIDGRLEGAIECAKTVLVGERARVKASIAADEVRICGTVEGNIAARRKITLERTAVVTGDLSTLGIVIEEGAKLKGRIVIGSDEQPALDRPAKSAQDGQASGKPQAPGPKADPVRTPQPTAASA